MITKEECELYDALSREIGEPMSPYEELVLLGVYEAEFEPLSGDEDERSEEYDEGYEICHREEAEEYEFDENDEQYRMLCEVLKMNNDRRKYFA